MMHLHNLKCFNNHLGNWLIEPRFFQNAVRAIKDGTWTLRAEEPQPRADLGQFEGPRGKEQRAYALQSGVALIELDGPLMKGYSKFGGSSTMAARQQLRQAQRDPECNSIMLLIDSPGGTVAGTEDLAADVSATNKMKPVHCQVSDQCASAAYWVASQCSKIFANSTALVGSIGTLAVIEDTSRKAELEGVKVHVISTGDLKGAFTEGAPVTAEALAYMQGIVDQTNEFFLAGVASGRNMDKRNVKKAATGETFLASVAKDMGLIDGIQSADETLSGLVKSYGPKPKKQMSATEAGVGMRLRVTEASLK